MKRAQCSHEKPGGARCARSAASGVTTCSVHTPGYVRKPRAAKVVHKAPAIAMMGTVPFDIAISALGGDRAAMAQARTFMRPIDELPPPEAMHGAEVMDQRAPCGDVHDEFNACRVCDAPRVEIVDRDAKPANALQLFAERGHEVWLADWRQLAERAADLGGVDTTMPDAPYSERTHRGHDSGTGQANRVADWGAREAAKGRTKKAGGVSLARMVEYAEEHGAPRRALNYRPWTEADVVAFADAWAPLTRGWFGTLTDHVLAPFWEAAFKRHGRYVFSPLSCVDPGSRFRAVGDGPSQWSCLLVVSRPSSGAWLDEWREKRRGFGLPRALRGAHCDPRGRGDSQTGNREEKVPGAKPLWMMLDILSDYSMPGELVADPTCGGGTLGLAAHLLGRRALLGDVMREHAEKSVRVMRGVRGGVVADADRDSLQLALLAGGA